MSINLDPVFPNCLFPGRMESFDFWPFSGQLSWFIFIVQTENCIRYYWKCQGPTKMKTTHELLRSLALVKYVLIWIPATQMSFLNLQSLMLKIYWNVSCWEQICQSCCHWGCQEDCHATPASQDWLLTFILWTLDNNHLLTPIIHSPHSTITLCLSSVWRHLATGSLYSTSFFLWEKLFLLNNLVLL